MTILKGGMIIQTMIAIMIVDFPWVFPRFLVKTEDYGWAIMDIGVSATMFSMGYTHKKTSSQNNNFLKELIHSVFGNLAVCLAASVRFILLTSIDYHDHVTEWGTHWNFYLTIAVLNVVFVFVRSSDYALVVGLALLIG